MKYFITWLLLAGSAAASYGQGRDTAFAVHKLFLKKRKGADAALAGGADMVSSAATLNGALQGALVGATPVLLGLRQAQRFSVERERAILDGYASGAPIPADVRQLLRRKYFHRTVADLPARR